MTAPNPSTPSEIGALGLRAAASIVEQMLSLSRQLTEVRFPLVPLEPEAAPSDGKGNGSGSGNGAGPLDRRQQMRQLRSDAERLIELYADWTRALLDGAARLADAEDAPSEMLTAAGAPGSTACMTAWLHVLDGPPAPPARLHASDLIAHDGSRLPSEAIAFDPAIVSTSDRGSSVAVKVMVDVPPDAVVATYHGHLLAEGLPEVCLPMRVEVT